MYPPGLVIHQGSVKEVSIVIPVDPMVEEMMIIIIIKKESMKKETETKRSGHLKIKVKIKR
jgi:hypothetical protein